MSWQQRIEQALTERRASAAYRSRQVNQGGNGRHIQLHQQRYLNFSGNDYLGLSRHPAVIDAWQQGARQYGVGSGGSGHVTGFCEAHQQLEQQLAQWLGYPRALLFISGYAANQALLAALMQADDRILADKLSHASLLEAAAHSPAQLRRFRHNQPAALADLLAKPCGGQQLVVTEGVFSMDGDSAPLAQLQQLSRQAGAWLMVDDAHGIGVHGEQGRGSCWQQGVRPEALVVTFGKAFGVSGAAILCDEPLAEYLLQFARHLIYSTAMPPAQACALQAALRCVQQGDALRSRLQQHIARFRRGVADLPLTLSDSQTAIQPLLVGDNQRALTLAQRLREQGLWVSAIRPPTVPPGGARLRITLTAAHQAQDIDRLLEVLHAVSE
ncbi:8-amino-7-oxononanoate synthase [Serratia rhizosphaerae]|uniref:8-amino-7-oxononanoate synthase n=1 Tax=Serratia sp. MYb239 TaxID=2033438 RepID=UPI000CF6CEFA|nr:8-amino-7-oxononanoate synthase [Serratia sp. MYb239]AVJ16716.1 8-amino-7-oxononanoate synthase [Serratia sp. MYb239]MBU3894089.1 8-amino-7-oxononanoate synthase [Serratia rubidaea]MCA4823283.1 8-amino-7-oxononanoate synthase [Serratia rubidaea]SQJ26283.1 8-amino-7-oxononanoate synthase [Serratia rubidaea]